MNAEQPTIIYTLTDEAPLLATYAFLPVIRAFADAAGIDVKTSDISVAARILAEFLRLPDRRAARAGQPGRTGRADAAARHEHHQAAEHQRLGAAAHWPPSRNCRTKGYAIPDYPGRSEDRRGKGHQGSATASAWAAR